MKNMTKNDQLNQLFEKWKQHVNGEIKLDGIINEELYNNADPKILFIEKEPNDPKQEAGDFREWWKKGIKFSFSIRIAEWSYGILEKFPEYDSVGRSYDEAYAAIQNIAFMNIKKTGGQGSSQIKDIINHIENDEIYRLIHKEIVIINPDIVILGLSKRKLRNKLFPGVEWKDSGYDVAIGLLKEVNARVIDFYHPSSRNAPSASYSLLQNIINSEKFKTL